MKAKDEEDAYSMVVDLMEKLYDKKDPIAVYGRCE